MSKIGLVITLYQDVHLLYQLDNHRLERTPVNVAELDLHSPDLSPMGCLLMEILDGS